MKPADTPALAERVKKFLSINEKAKLTDLKLHLNCTGTDILLASGWLMKENYASVTREGADMWISRKNPGNEPS